MILLIDNYDSFTWNLVQRIGELDASIELRVVRNDKITPDEAERLAPERIIISPGPGTPNDAGVSREILDRFEARVPILGVCLGHQCIGDCHAMPVVRHNRIMHGKTSRIHHDGRGIFEGLSNPFTATRYHSLIVDPGGGVPEGWEVSAWTEDPGSGGKADRIIMGLRRVQRPGEAPLDGVQFHPESFLTDEGPGLLANFLGLPRPQATVG